MDTEQVKPHCGERGTDVGCDMQGDGDGHHHDRASECREDLSAAGSGGKTPSDRRLVKLC